eukprot:GHVU01049278.1.p2 GENE.GHVU01049278.1~~GHVU01049278.1.p2  ORF type:complete len:182 (-),score=6.23 GHVU01049278.1:839-1384(-)
MMKTASRLLGGGAMCVGVCGLIFDSFGVHLVRDDCMSPVLLPGDLLLVQKRARAHRGDLVRVLARDSLCRRWDEAVAANDDENVCLNCADAKPPPPKRKPPRRVVRRLAAIEGDTVEGVWGGRSTRRVPTRFDIPSNYCWDCVCSACGSERRTSLRLVGPGMAPVRGWAGRRSPSRQSRHS